jgi:hypothetical protein
MKPAIRSRIRCDIISDTLHALPHFSSAMLPDPQKWLQQLSDRLPMPERDF